MEKGFLNPLQVRNTLVELQTLAASLAGRAILRVVLDILIPVNTSRCLLCPHWGRFEGVDVGFGRRHVQSWFFSVFSIRVPLPVLYSCTLGTGVWNLLQILLVLFPVVLSSTVLGFSRWKNASLCPVAPVGFWCSWGPPQILLTSRPEQVYFKYLGVSTVHMGIAEYLCSLVLGKGMMWFLLSLLRSFLFGVLAKGLGQWLWSEN